MTGTMMSDKTGKLPKLSLQLGAPDKALPLLALLLALLGAWLLWSGVRQWRAEAADSALMAERCTLRGMMILSPRCTAVSTIACTAEVVPPTMKKACAAWNASAASASASRMTETGWQRLSSIFIELTSTSRQAAPRKSRNSGLPRPRLCPGTSNGTRRARFMRSSASSTGARSWVSSCSMAVPFNRYCGR